ncbi:TIGR02444 family protein [Pseudomonas sp. S75]|uniref:TIGR02444 family protein n=1 Tax=unclassified Pseudomonas TaxID=196821 RepID=UPI0019083EE6|nr:MULTISPECIES: TIGR02444 family protein [unclassified Pseudomonas]MBJ9977567.1 TIGR02444 family protein [Pseudomonas sp. S30]MBK0155231.1 TIGR02444 family protein [Pseudomonas sp. S75]
MHTDLWDHALGLYARPGVEHACLALQALGGDVCLLLCGTWLQARRVVPDAMRVQALRDISLSWQRDVLSPLRALRQAWREAAREDAQLATLREQVKALELDAERTLLGRLQALASEWPAGPDGQAGDWLNWLAPTPAIDHGALEQLRAAAVGLQASAEED